MSVISDYARKISSLSFAVMVALAALGACSAKDQVPGAVPGAGKPPPPTVGVISVAPQSVALSTELPGRVEAQRVAQVRARVSGVVLKRQFTEGSEVRDGQALFLIDPALYQAALDSANAQLARAQSNLDQASATEQRYRPLAEARAISQQDYINATAARKAATADLAAARAAVRSASINLGYTQVSAPIAGRIGRALVTEGALVSAAEATQLALIQQTSVVYVNFMQSSVSVLELRKALAAKKLRRIGGNAVPVTVVLEDGSELPRPGKLLFSDLSVDASTGQVMLRAEVPNPDGWLLPGQYVRVRLSQAELPAAFLLPQQAVTRSDQGDSVLVVAEGNKPARRSVTVGFEHKGKWVITAGLKEGDKVIVDGFQKMFVPGEPVNPVPWKPTTTAAPTGTPVPTSGAAARS